jgi:hypothetical protein
MSINKTANGYWVVSDIVGGYLTNRTYIGYTKAEALEAFAIEFGIDTEEEN